MENSGRENIDIYLCTGKERDSSLSKTGVMWDAPFPVFSEWEIVPHEGKQQCHYYWSDQKKIPLGPVLPHPQEPQVQDKDKNYQPGLTLPTELLSLPQTVFFSKLWTQYSKWSDFMFQNWNSSFPWKMQAQTTVGFPLPGWGYHVSLRLTVYSFIHIGHQPRLYSNRTVASL